MEVNKGALAGLVLIMLLGGVVGGYYLKDALSTPPSDHAEVLSNLSIRLIHDDGSEELEREFVNVNTKKSHGYYEPPLIAVINVPADFEEGNEYLQSQWNYVDSIGVIKAVAVVFGPDETGKVYTLEISRSATKALEVWYGSLVWTMEKTVDWWVPIPGYVWMTVQLD